MLRAKAFNRTVSGAGRGRGVPPVPMHGQDGPATVHGENGRCTSWWQVAIVEGNAYVFKFRTYSCMAIIVGLLVCLTVRMTGAKQAAGGNRPGGVRPHRSFVAMATQ